MLRHCLALRVPWPRSYEWDLEIAGAWTESEGREYRHVRNKKQYAEAKQDCEDKGAQMLTIRTEAENNFIKSQMRQ